MRTLYVCRGNIGRSQMAVAFHNYYRSLEADSAGVSTKEERRGKKLGDLNGTCKNVIDCMAEVSLNMLSRSVTQLNGSMIPKYDKIIVMADPNSWPEYLKNSDKVEYWEIEDPKGQDLEFHKKVRDSIKSRVEALIHEIDIMEVLK